MNPDAVERKLAAILSADVVGYSRLMAEDEAGTIRILTDYREAIAMLVRQHRGRVVDTAGDSLLAEFPTATEAVSCAVEIQGVLGARNAPLPADRKMEFRIGIHLGEVRVEGERVYGDGVNIAARLEGLAEPGSICISDIIYKQVRNKLELACEDLGDRSVKNIPEPVRVYRIGLEPLEAPETHGLPGMDELTVPGFGSRSAIAVLPFDNLSGDPEQEYFADGIAEDLITRLSTWRDFPVIARNSSFVYKGKAVDVKQVSRQLGVRYVVEGSVRKGGDRVRISAQLIDATTGHHVWAETYDRELRDVLAVQDEITEAIVVSMYPGLQRSERERALRKDPRELDAWDCTQRASWHLGRLTKEDNARARPLFERAIELDSRSVEAYYGLAAVHNTDILLQWSESPAQSIAELNRVAQECAALDGEDPLTQFALGMSYSAMGRRDEAMAAFELGLQLNPNVPWAYSLLGFWLAMAGRSEEALATLDKGMRLSPHDPAMWLFLYSKALAHLAAERHDEAARWAQESLRRRPGFSPCHRILAASYVHLGRLPEARAAVEEILRLNPEFSLEGWRRSRPAVNPSFLERFIDSLRKAGLKE